MVTLNQKGSGSGLLIAVILLALLFLGAGGFAIWAYGGRQDYKNNVDTKVQAAVGQAIKAEDVKKDAQFAQDYKQPLKVYSGPDTFGSIRLSYPKTWSAYVIEDDAGATNLDGYFQPDVVPSVSDPNNSFALRMQVVSQSPSEVLKQYNNLVQSKKATVTPYSLPQVKSVIGSRIDGALSNTKSGSLVVLPLRDKTLKVWTEAPQYVSDFNNLILANLTFSP